MMEDFNRAPVLVEIVSTDPLDEIQRKTTCVGDQHVVARFYAEKGVNDGLYRIVKELPKDASYGKWNN